MGTTEHTINDVLADLLRGTRRAWDLADVVNSENTGMLKGSTERPDILVVEPNVSPVIVEIEVYPAITVEIEARSRLGAKVRKTGRSILSTVAVRLPISLRKVSGKTLRKALSESSEIEMAVYTGANPDAATRWPTAGWICGGISDLSVLVQAASVPPDVIDDAATQLVEGVSEAAGLLNEMAHTHSGAAQEICQELRQEDSEQTRRMAATILANAFVFQETLAGGPGKLATVKSIGQLRTGAEGITKTKTLEQWKAILKVNYWPIFDIARRILESIPTTHSKTIIEGLADTAES